MLDKKERYRYFLTTVDNPFDPCFEYDAWALYDKQSHPNFPNGYNCSERLARFALTSDELSEEENQYEINRAITRIIVLDPFNIFKRVVKTADEVATAD